MVETIRVGDRVRSEIAWKNTGTDSHKFTLGWTIRHVASEKDFDLALETDSTSAGKSDDKKSDWWTVPMTAPKGNYSIIGAVWAGQSRGVPFDRLDDDFEIFEGD